ncbi:MAG: hypothetical protein EOP45_05470 [Sphingobacteriaceae bacterium]|nr:MAG: hypothetical protein EOP45_05470 [Sphingobacteriaceae bacterium]
MDTEFYADLQRSLECTIHHRPSGADEQQVSRAIRLERMTRLYKTIFGNLPKESSQAINNRPDHLGNSVSNVQFRPTSTQVLDHVFFLYISSSTGPKLKLDVTARSTIEDIKTLVKNHMDIPFERQRFIYSGQNLQNHHTLEDYSISKSGETVHLVHRP